MELVRTKIRTQRLLNGYSQEYMAMALNVSQSTYSKLENGDTELTLSKLVMIARLLDVNPVELLDSSPNTVEKMKQDVNGKDNYINLYEKYTRSLEEEVKLLREKILALEMRGT